MGERAGDERLSRSGRPADDQVEGLSDPVAGGELGQGCAGDAAPGTAVDVLDACADAQLGLAQMAEIAPVLALFGFALDQHGEAVVEAELLEVGDAALLLECLGHAGEAELQHAFDIALSQGHGVASIVAVVVAAADVVVAGDGLRGLARGAGSARRRS